MRYEFAGCELDLDRYVLRRSGHQVHVEPQVFQLIACLVRANGALVSYDQLMAEVWDGRIVSDATVAARVSAARTALGDSGKQQAVIRTVPRRGLQLSVEARAATSCDAPRFSKDQVIRFTSSRDGTGIAWAEIGEGPPLLRGGHWLGHLEHDWSSPVWQPLLSSLGSTHRLIRYDPRGTGLSDRELNGATVEELADDMEAVADAAGLERFPIFAMSQSVPVALTLAARRPERVSGLILVNGLVQGSTARGDPQATETMVGMIGAGWGVPRSAFMRAIATVFMPRATAEEVESLVEMQAMSTTPELAAQIRRMIGEIDVQRCLDRIECPALVMHCAGDQVQSPEQSRLLARTLKRAEFHILDSGNHIVVPSEPAWEALIGHADQFLAREGVDENRRS